MILTRDQNHGDYEIDAYEPGKLSINKTIYTNSILIGPHQLTDWAPQNLQALVCEDFDKILSWQPNIVLLGTGTTLSFPAPYLLQTLYDHQIGVEVMSTLAACRTFKILMSESRNAVAALLIR